MTQALLTTKFYIQKLPDNYVSRTRALMKMTEAYHKNHQLTLVCAPAGYGKTTVVLEALFNMPCSKAWISLDEGDNDVQRFLSYFTGALNNAGVEIGDDITCLLTELTLNKPDTILTLLINRIAEKETGLIVVLDDYHLIHSDLVHEVMKQLLEYQPPNLHLILITREDPKLPLARLRMKDKLTQIRLEDLVFSKEDTLGFFQKNVHTEYDLSMIAKMNERIEGWIAGIKLTGLLLTDMQSDQAASFLSRFNGTSNYIIDYLVEEVLGHLTEDLKEFLCRTSILERMNDKLCNELTGRTDSRQLLQQIEKKNLFLIPLDYNKEWFRYHHLFADSLQTNLEEETKKALYRRASVWMLRSGYYQEAVRYAFRSGDMQLAVATIGESMQYNFQNGELISLYEWISKIPEDIVRDNEILCVRKAIVLFIVGKAEEGIRHIQSLGEDFMEHASSQNKGLMLSFRAMIANIQGQDAEPLAGEAMKYLEDWDPIAKVSNLNTLGRARCAKGDITGARAAFEQAYESGMRLGYQFVTTLALMNYTACLAVMGQKERAFALCGEYLNNMEDIYDKLPPYTGVIYLVLSRLHQVGKEEELAVFYKEKGNNLCKMISFDGEGSLRIYDQLFNLTKEESRDQTFNPTNLSSANAIHNNLSPGEAARNPSPEYTEKLSEREVQLLELLKKGLSNQEIADTLFITINTTQWHLSHIYAKLGVKSRAQALVRAREIGI